MKSELADCFEQTSVTSPNRRSSRAAWQRRLKKLRTFARYYFHGFRSCAFLFGLGFLQGRHRKTIYKLASELAHLPADPDKPAALLPSIQIADLLQEAEDFRILEPLVLDGNVSLLELVVINQLLRRYQVRNCFEIGTFDGRSALNLAANCADDGRIYTLDLPQSELASARLPLEASDIHYITKEASGLRFQGTEYQAKVCQLYGDSAAFDYSPFLGRMDCVFVDGSHSYEYVLNDSARALQLLDPKGGIVLWHDYDSWPCVTRCLNMLSREKPEFQNLTHIQGTTLALLVNRSL